MGQIWEFLRPDLKNRSNEILKKYWQEDHRPGIETIRDWVLRPPLTGYWNHQRTGFETIRELVLKPSKTRYLDHQRPCIEIIKDRYWDNHQRLGFETTIDRILKPSKTRYWDHQMPGTETIIDRVLRPGLVKLSVSVEWRNTAVVTTCGVDVITMITDNWGLVYFLWH